jgi:hypothetical protein
MLTITSHVPAIAAASRRALKAAALTVQLYGGRVEDCSIGSAGLPSTCIYDPSARLLLIPTCADRPLLLGEAEELVRSVQEDALIVRLSTWPNAQYLVTFDLLLRHHWDVEVTTSWLPCVMDHPRQLRLVDATDGTPRVYVGPDGVRRNVGVPPPSGAARTQAGVSRAAKFFQQQIWGGV